MGVLLPMVESLVGNDEISLSARRDYDGEPKIQPAHESTSVSVLDIQDRIKAECAGDETAEADHLLLAMGLASRITLGRNPTQTRQDHELLELPATEVSYVLLLQLHGAAPDISDPLSEQGVFRGIYRFLNTSRAELTENMSITELNFHAALTIKLDSLLRGFYSSSSDRNLASRFDSFLWGRARKRYIQAYGSPHRLLTAPPAGETRQALLDTFVRLYTRDLGRQMQT